MKKEEREKLAADVAGLLTRQFKKYANDYDSNIEYYEARVTAVKKWLTDTDITDYISDGIEKTKWPQYILKVIDAGAPGLLDEFESYYVYRATGNITNGMDDKEAAAALKEHGITIE